MSQEPNEAVLEEGTAPAKIKRPVGRPRRNQPKVERPKVRKPYGMKNSSIMEKGGSAANQNAKYRGFCGQCVRLKVLSNSGESRFPPILDIKLGDLPQVHILVNREVIVPIEALGVLNDTTVEVLAPGILRSDEVREMENLVRIPTQVFGPASWEEYEAFLASERTKPLTPAKTR